MNKTNGIIEIHGKQYMTVAERLRQAHDHEELLSVETEVLVHDPVVIKAIVKMKSGKFFTGISSANPEKSIEKANPYEVAETSAVGRALGFAGFGLIESVASADEVQRAVQHTENGNIPEHDINDDEPPPPSDNPKPTEVEVTCEVCGAVAVEKKGISKNGKNYHGIFCSTDNKSHTRWLWN